MGNSSRNHGTWHLIMVLVASLSCCCGCAPTALAEIPFATADFSFRLPEGWVEIPHEVIAASAVPNWDYGFQGPAAIGWFGMPYILIEHDHIGKLSRKELRALMGAARASSLEGAARSNAPPGLNNFTVDSFTLNEATNEIWYRTRSDTPRGPMVAYTVMIPTEDGILKVGGYAAESDTASFGTLFKGIVGTIMLDPANKYRTDRGSGFWMGLAQLALYLIGLAAFYIFFWYFVSFIVMAPAYGVVYLVGRAPESGATKSGLVWAIRIFGGALIFLFGSLLPAILYSAGVFAQTIYAMQGTSMPLLYGIIGGLVCFAMVAPNGDTGCAMTVPAGLAYLVFHWKFQELGLLIADRVAGTTHVAVTFFAGLVVWLVIGRRIQRMGRSPD